MNTVRERPKGHLQVLVVEDDYLLSEVLVDSLTMLGCTVVARASNFDQAMELATQSTCDLAIVDIDLRGIAAFPVVERLRERGIGFVIATASDAEDLPSALADAPMVSKPYDVNELSAAMNAVAAAKGAQQA